MEQKKKSRCCKCKWLNLSLWTICECYVQVMFDNWMQFQMHRFGWWKKVLFAWKSIKLHLKRKCSTENNNFMVIKCLQQTPLFKKLCMLTASPNWVSHIFFFLVVAVTQIYFNNKSVCKKCLYSFFLQSDSGTLNQWLKFHLLQDPCWDLGSVIFIISLFFCFEYTNIPKSWFAWCTQTTMYNLFAYNSQTLNNQNVKKITKVGRRNKKHKKKVCLNRLFEYIFWYVKCQRTQGL